MKKGAADLASIVKSFASSTDSRVLAWSLFDLNCQLALDLLSLFGALLSFSSKGPKSRLLQLFMNSCPLELADAGLGVPLLRSLDSLTRSPIKDPELLLLLITCVNDLAPCDPKLLQGLRLSTSPVVPVLISAIKWTGASSAKLLLSSLSLLLCISKTSAGALVVQQKECVRPLLALLSHDGVRIPEILESGSCLLRNLAKSEACFVDFLPRGIVRPIYELVVQWSKGESRLSFFLLSL